MAWFDTNNMTGKGLRESINDILQWECSESCMNQSGLIASANATYFVRNAHRFPWVVVRTVDHAPYGGAYGTHQHIDISLDAHFVIKPEHKEAFGEFMEDLKGLSEYPIIDENIYSEIQLIAVDDAIDEIAEANDVDALVLRELIYDADIYSDCDSEGYVTFDCDMSAVVEEARRKSQTWMVHYYAGKFHTPSACSYCADASVAS